jgi:hypothetical protein
MEAQINLVTMHAMYVKNQFDIKTFKPKLYKLLMYHNLVNMANAPLIPGPYNVCDFHLEPRKRLI